LLTCRDDVDLDKRLAVWERFYNYDRPHGALGYRTPVPEAWAAGFASIPGVLLVGAHWQGDEGVGARRKKAARKKAAGKKKAARKKAPGKKAVRKKAATRKKAVRKKAATRKKAVRKKAVRKKAAGKKKAPDRKVAAPPPPAAPSYTPLAAARPAVTPQPAAAAPAVPRLGIVTHFYGHANAAIVRIESGEIRVGDMLRFIGHTTDFEQRVDRIELEHAQVPFARAGQEVGVQVRERVREHDEVRKVL
jgi:hypothetical protein